MASIFGIIEVKTLFDKGGMLMVAGKDDGLGQPVPAFHRMPMLHKVLEHLIHRVLVKEPVIDGRCIDLVRESVRLPIITPVQLFPLGLFLSTEQIIVNTDRESAYPPGPPGAAPRSRL
ncbi:hypothetical protein H206_02121 [Candidatus Electrothrix aarhusensis]|uniref:Uncharacterized protein n=1 Tax=Candidatus Electrothrix aarhusensis TaxID=1859131 RepID=A0A444IUA8_9BACT|nr:hypothetical protein H206_02121 [Candidatus Electrothrix aarhusensis]